jgi:DNA-binding PadR family transcriptional regulator
VNAIPSVRKLSSGELQLVILALLAENDAHGYELIKIIEERSNGFYSPSPGVIYPALTYLAEIRFTNVEADGSRKLYNLMDDGRNYLANNLDEVEIILDTLSRIGQRMDDVRAAFAGFGDLDGGASEVMHRARHLLKHALRRKRNSAPDEQLRISKILERAATDILSR